MPIENKRTSNVCDRCGKEISIVGKLADFDNKLLCSECYKKTENEKNLKCPKCKKKVGIEKITEYKTEPMCYECMGKIQKKEERIKETKKFFKKNWYKWIIIGLTIFLIGISLVAIPIFAPSHPEYSEEKCSELEADRKELQKQYGTYDVYQNETLRLEVLGQIRELTIKIKNSCLSPEELCDLGNAVYFKDECLKISEVPRDVYLKAFHFCNDLSASQKMAGHYYPVKPCIKEKVLLYLTNPELLEPEPKPTVEEHYQMICSSPDGYCMSKVGMNNRDAYGECLDRWVPFCRTYEPESQQKLTPDIVCGEGTIRNEKGQCVPDPNYKTSSNSPFSGGGCLIATATYGTELAPQVQKLREIRDNSLLKTQSGQTFMKSFNVYYYSISPIIADYERQNPIFKEVVKLTITPLLASLSILNYVDLDSEQEILGYGISLIILNVGMYVVAPVGIGLIIKRRF